MVDDSLIGGKKLPPVLPGLFLFRLRARSARAALPGLLETLLVALDGFLERVRVLFFTGFVIVVAEGRESSLRKVPLLLLLDM